jgi:hypothetical protein
VGEVEAKHVAEILEPVTGSQLVVLVDHAPSIQTHLDLILCSLVSPENTKN